MPSSRSQNLHVLTSSFLVRRISLSGTTDFYNHAILCFAALCFAALEERSLASADQPPCFSRSLLTMFSTDAALGIKFRPQCGV